ncbi:MAG: two-component system, chemotaxis family, sensor kinase Cph1 [Acetobacteraceae bacterium]|jgi:chemotaxis family two-component system sensor kinase Cph1|nr:two-component system, chemotaxis family, sensor kinase Cph1 [Acetobacteraceae bacterium]
MGLTSVPIDLTICDREPIHIPGSIQPHGMMLVAECESLIVRHAAGSIEQRLGITDWEGRPLNALIGELAGKIAKLARPGSAGFMGQLRTVGGETLDVSAHLSGLDVIVELELAAEDRLDASLVLDGLSAAAAAFEQTGSLKTLCEKAATEFRRLTGFDRVMIYQFLDDGAGNVLAEDRRADMHSFLNHRFPSSDIPQQARALYLRNLIRLIPDSSYEPAVLRPAWIAPVPLDMTDSSLRSVSPVHLQYLANMNVRASASVSIVKDGALWGLIACHHETPRSLSYGIRAACRSLAGSLGRQIRAQEEAEGYRQRIRLRGFEDDMVALLSREGALDDALSHHLSKLGRMMNSDGVAVLRGRELVRNGVCPTEQEIDALVQWLSTETIQPIVSADHLSDLYPQASSFTQTGSGLLAMVISVEEPWFLLWFRAEQVETVNWAGNPHKSDGSEEPGASLTPRTSFDLWQETVRGRARPWSLPEIDAALRLRVALLEVQQNRRMRELNRQLTKIVQDKDLLLEQNGFLIGEVNHRVQNSLQLVSSYLALQARASSNPELLAALEEARRRISAVSLVHRRLYRGDQLALVDAGRYIEELCADTFAFMGQDWVRYLSLNLSPVMVSTDRAVTLGLLLTELLINANKYAYDGRAGPIEIELIEDRTLLHLVVADKGTGKASSGKGFGTRIMEGLVAQLGGKLTYGDNLPGLRTVVVIPIQSPPR